MNIRTFSTAGILVLLLATGCKSDREIRRIDALWRDPNWPMIRAAAEIKVERRDGNTFWSHSARFSPLQHTNGVWVVLASAPYPGNTYGDWIKLTVRDDGTVLSYSPNLPAR